MNNASLNTTIDVSNLQTVSTVIPEGKNTTARRGLLILTVACAALTLIPPFKLGASIAMRSVSFLTSSLNCAENWNSDSDLGKFAKICKIAIVTLGIVALAISMPVLLVVSLVADIGLQAIAVLKAISDGDGRKALTHFSILVIDAFGLAAMLTGMWELMVAAASVTALALLVLAIKVGMDGSYNNMENGVDAFCYAALSAFGVYTAVTNANSK